MPEFFTLAEYDEAAQAVRARTAYQPRTAIILGSGLGELAYSVQKADVIPFIDIPHFAVSTVPGHQGRLVIGLLENQPVLVMQGRVHYYEGYSMAQVGLPIRMMQRLGIGMLIVTNAAGAINPAFTPGDLMLINDHVNLIGMGGLNPLRGPNLDELGPRFPDMSQPYDRGLLALAKQAADEQQMKVQEGVYVCLAGPSFESPADLRFLSGIGADAVGMSTVPEVIVARHGGMRVLGISGISNKANLDGSTLTTHEEVLAAGRMITPRLSDLVKGVLAKL
jgi:purine-nucleoside phosphorylase